jgi:hypothetical protein
MRNYTRFYFRSIKPNKAAIERGAARLPAGSDGIFGLQFENLILKNRPALWRHPGLRAEDIVFDNPYWQTATQRTRGCQLDYVIQCRNNTVYVCEIKFSKAPIARAVITEVDTKIRALQKPRNFTFRPILIHVNGVDDARWAKPAISTASLILASCGNDLPELLCHLNRTDDVAVKLRKVLGRYPVCGVAGRASIEAV